MPTNAGFYKLLRSDNRASLFLYDDDDDLCIPPAPISLLVIKLTIATSIDLIFQDIDHDSG